MNNTKTHIILECITIKNLFNRFDYAIDLRNGENVSILIAPNGCGKTTIFKIVNFIFRPTLQAYREVSVIPFDECECALSNGKKIKLKSKAVEEMSTELQKKYADILTMKNQGRYADRENSVARRVLTLHVGTKSINCSKEFKEIASTMDSDMISLYENADYSYLESEGMSPRFKAGLGRMERFTNRWMDFIKDNDCFISVNFITADRLHTKNEISRFDTYRQRRMGLDISERSDDPIKRAQKKTRDLYNQMREEYAELQSKAKDELPKRFLKGTDSPWDFDEFKDKWNQYVKDIEKYYELGLLDSAETIINERKLKKYYEDKGEFLTIYLDAFARTLKPFSEHYEKLKLFADIFNERNRITKKTISYGRKGIVLKTEETELPLDCLSSGEKNDFVMFYDLIFNSEEQGLVLIDEPEISLHIEWQQTFLDSLLEICKMNGLQAIVATHSPNIIHGHRELFAERGLEYEAGDR